MRVAAIVQARMGSRRLPGKVLADLASNAPVPYPLPSAANLPLAPTGRPVLAEILDRLKKCNRVDYIGVATTTSPHDEPVVRLALAAGCTAWAGKTDDVLGRFVEMFTCYHTALATADVVVRITGDCPFVDPATVDACVGALGSNDFASNIWPQRTYPKGLDVEVFPVDTLHRLHRMSTTDYQREHVTACVKQEPGLFRCASMVWSADASDLNVCVDTPEDLDRARALYAGLGMASRTPSVDELVTHLRPDVAA